MQITPLQIKRYTTIGLILLAVITLAIFLFSLRFRITEASPNPQNYPSSLGVLNLTFNRKLDRDAIQKSFQESPDSVIDFSFESTATIRVEESKLFINIGQTPLPGRYTIKLNNIKAQDGSILSETLNLNVVDIPYERLSTADRKLYDEAALEGETEEHNPFAGILPHETQDYKISYSVPGEDVELPPTIIITMKFFAPGNAAVPATASQKQDYLNRLRAGRVSALEFLKSKNIDVNKNIMQYTELDLRDEFPAGYVAEPHDH